MVQRPGERVRAPRQMTQNHPTHKETVSENA